MKKIIQSLLIVAGLVACAHSAKTSEVIAPSPIKKNVVLMSGSHLDENSWVDVARLLPIEKYQVEALPRIGRDVTHPSHMAEIAALTCAKLTGPTVVVAHSFAGAVTNSMVGICPEKITKIIYVAAVIPMDGERAMDGLKGVDQKAYMAVVTVEKDRIIPKSETKLLVVLDSAVNPNSLILPNVYPEPLLPGTDRVKFKTPDLERIPKYYIYTTQDKIIPVEIQKKLTSRTNIKASDSVPAGHLPMLTQPAALAKLIDTFATAP